MLFVRIHSNAIKVKRRHWRTENGFDDTRFLALCHSSCVHACIHYIMRLLCVCVSLAFERPWLDEIVWVRNRMFAYIDLKYTSRDQ